MTAPVHTLKVANQREPANNCVSCNFQCFFSQYLSLSFSPSLSLSPFISTHMKTYSKATFTLRDQKRSILITFSTVRPITVILLKNIWLHYGDWSIKSSNYPGAIKSGASRLTTANYIDLCLGSSND